MTRAGAASWSPPQGGGATRLILVRHGETSLTAQRRYSGRGDVDLSDAGLVQAQAVADRLFAMLRVSTDDAGASGPDAGAGGAVVVSSPLLRCRGTAARIADRLGVAPVLVDDGLVECDFGAWEGLTFAEVKEQWPAELDEWLGSPHCAPPQGESFVAVAARVGATMDRLVATHTDRTVIVVSHVSPIKLALRDALAATDAFLHRLFLDPAGISVLDRWPDGGVAVRTINDTAHLR